MAGHPRDLICLPAETNSSRTRRRKLPLPNSVWVVAVKFHRELQSFQLAIELVFLRRQIQESNYFLDTIEPFVTPKVKEHHVLNVSLQLVKQRRDQAGFIAGMNVVIAVVSQMFK